MSAKDARWSRWLLPPLVLIVAAVIGYAFNFILAIAIIVIFVAIWISRALQWSEPPEPGE
ncbi:MAG TPA: hypothetical protein VNZ57_08465 [Longimicrobiales bacterium]|nr:hypothetical protein [Longimicrobiales bacterium]